MGTNVQQSGSGGSVDVTFHGDLALVTMRRGQNRLNDQMLEQFNKALDKVLENPNIKAVATTGEGRFYCNGLDLDWMMSLDGDKLKGFVSDKGLGHILSRLLVFPLPTIALLNGHAFAGGAMLTLSHDHVIMQTGRGWWCLNEVHIKLRFSELLLNVIQAKLPRGQSFHDAAVLGRRFTADEALASRIVHEICAPAELLNSALTWTKNIVPASGYDRDHLEQMKRDAYKSVLDGQQNTESFDQFKAKM